jgi:outer membrane lipoprotein carrier protein
MRTLKTPPDLVLHGRTVLVLLGMLAAMAASPAARADAVQTLRDFVRDVKSGQAGFTQTVTAADGARRRDSSGRFEFQRPDRFRFAYEKPFEQLIVADGRKVWIWDADLNQASSRPYAQALGATPAALLAGVNLDTDFVLSNAPVGEAPRGEGLAALQWAVATPKVKDGAFQSMRVGFKGRELAAVEIVDSFGQRSLIRFVGFSANPSLASERFSFTPPAGADVIEQ